MTFTLAQVSRAPSRAWARLVVARLNDRGYLTGRLNGMKCAPSLITIRACGRGVGQQSDQVQQVQTLAASANHSRLIIQVSYLD